MKILYYCLRGRGGAFSNIKLLLKTMADTFPKDEIVLAGMRGMSFGEVEKCPNVRVVPMAVVGNLELTRLWQGYVGLPKLVHALRPDVLWCQSLGTYRRVAVPMVITMNNPHQTYPWAVTRLHPQNPIYVYALRCFFRRSLRISDGLITQTQLMADYISQIKGAPANIEVIAKAVENESDVSSQPLLAGMKEQMDAGPLRHSFTWLYVATHLPHKNHKVLMEIFSRLAREGIKARVIITLTDKEFLKLCPGAGALIEQGYIVPVGWIEKAQLKTLYDMCDGCLMPSMLESLSSAHLEAMAWGKPQISADMPYARDLCGEASLYADPGDPSAWVGKIKLAMENSGVRQALVASGRKRLELFPKTWSEVAGRTRGFLERIAKSK
jgi:glycosyltransferase involved in cell wall biosynthesis